MTHRVAVIGNFDGVHLGHRALLAAAREAAPGASLVVITFWPHPLQVLRPEVALKQLCSLAERQELLLAHGADHVEVVPFTTEFSQLTPEQFVDGVLVPLHLDRVVVGENFRFGHRASGSAATLADLGRAHGFAVTVLPLVRVADEDTCSTAIRRALAAGDLSAAEAQLGRRFAFRGTVVKGAQRGRELGFPTANLAVPDTMAAPADGVYAGWARRLDVETPEEWPVAVSVGTNPTFGDALRTVESYVLDRTDLELYGVPLEVEFVSHLRGQVTYTGLEPLIAQIGQDVEDTRRALGLAAVSSEH